MNWTNDQRKIIDARQCNLLVSAAAGSGKTAVLVERIIQMVCDTEHPIDIDQLLVVTFTKAAAAQMRDKIAKAIEKKLSENPDNEHLLKQMNLVNRANILTIDSFCFKVVKEHFHSLGIDPNIRVGDTGEIALLREEILEQIIEEFYENNADFVRFSEAFSSDKNDRNVADYILKIYDVCASYPRPEQWTCDARESLLVTDEEAFANVPVVKGFFEQLRAMAMDVRETILFALEQARSIDGPIHLEKTFLEDIQLVDDVISARTYSQFYALKDSKFSRIATDKKGVFDRDLEAELSALRKRYKDTISKSILNMFQIPFDTMMEQSKKQAPMLIALLDAVDAFRERFWQEKLSKNILEFSDVEHCALKILCKGYDEDGNAIPSEIGTEMSAEFVEIMIDEYQDSNYLQEAILTCVSTIPQGRNNMFMVGDVKQSIYGFRMARPDIFMDKYHTYSMEDQARNRKLLLKNNFRSRESVLEGINYLFYQIMGADLGGIDYTEDEALVCGNSFPDGMDDTVELLIGESKDFEFVNEDTNDKTGDDGEDLDEELEDIGRKELEASMVANRILELIANKDGKSMVTDEVTRELRPVQFSDIVILFRSPSSYQQVFYETLMSKGIPVRVQNEKGYLDSTEIHMLLSFLRVVDNPYDEVELAGSMRSFFGGFSNDDLAVLVLMKKQIENSFSEKNMKIIKTNKMPLFDVLRELIQPECNAEIQNVITKMKQQFEDYDWEQFIVKCNNYYQRVMRFMQKKITYSISELISDIYQNEDYYYYVESMPEGKSRVRNLELFLQESVKCGNSNFCSLFQFLQYVEKIQEKSIELGGDPGLDASENVVRIMSIHKSKGLEFPVVFVSGIGKQFNKMDTRNSMIIHSDYYLGTKYHDLEKRCANNTFIRQAMSKLIEMQTIAEELRVFYVALTRAKDKLILTGVNSDIPKLIQKYVHIAKRKERQLSFVNMRLANSYLDFVVMACMRNGAFEEAMKTVRERMDSKGENVISAKYERQVFFDDERVRFNVKIYSFMNLVVHHVKSDFEKEDGRQKCLYEWENQKADKLEAIQNALAWKYENESMTRQKSKLSVTEIKRIYETEFEPSDVVERFEPERFEAPIPDFLKTDKKMDAAQKGTWVHKTMELFDFANIMDEKGVQIFLDSMIAEGRIPDNIRTFFSEEMISSLLKSPLGVRMKEAAKRGELFKEKQFIVGVPASKLVQNESESTTSEEQMLNENEEVVVRNRSENDLILVQGIIDAYFVEQGKIILLDYKTDYAKEGDEDKLKKRYKTQLMYYRDTLRQLTGMEVAETYIYSFSLNKMIAI